MDLITDATSTLERLTQLRAAVDGKDEAKALDHLRLALAALASPIKALAIDVAVIRGEGVTISAVPDLTNARESVEKLLERFREAPKATTLRQGARWTNLTKNLETFAQKAQASLSTEWEHYFENHFFSGLPPAKREATLAAKTPQNAQALTRYRDLYQLFNKYRQQIPNNAEEFKKLRQLSQQLAEITFQEDVSEAVRKFLDTVSGGAELHLLTPEVLTWLDDNGLLANYVVRARYN